MKIRKNQLDNIPLLTAIVTTIIYLLIFIFRDYFPSINKIILFKESRDIFWSLPMEINLPWKISRLWDIPIIFIFTFMIMRLLKYLSKPKNKSEELYIGAILGLILGLIIGFCFLIKGGLGIDTKICFITGVVLSCLISLTLGIKKIFISGLKFSVALSIASGLALGFIVGLKTGFLISISASVLICLEMILIIALAGFLGSLIKYVISGRFLDVVSNILCGR